MKYRWSVTPGQPLLAGRLAAQLGIPALLAQCLVNRGLDDPQLIRSYLEPRLKELADPFLLPDMSVAVDRLLRARQNQESLVIFGDYDVDGVTSAALLLNVLKSHGWRVECYLPNRLDEGYGLTDGGVRNCLKKFPVTLLIAVDCGSTSINSIAWLQQQGVDVIVLDHHQVSDPAPAVVALVNPHKRWENPAAGTRLQVAPFTELCSVGLAFKLAHALIKRGRETGLRGAAEFDLRPLLDLVALGTIADVVPLRGENRILVSAGLGRLQTAVRPGLMALKRVAQCPPVLGVHEVGFQLAPRLNAAGRLEAAQVALELLQAPDLKSAMPLARSLDTTNRERQNIERGIAEQAIAAVKQKFRPMDDFVIVEGDPSWHVGVVGIVASRILQQFYRPTVIVGGDGPQWRGSGRSIAGFDLAAALRECGDLLVRHGGHAMAAGLSLLPSRLEEFRARFNEVARARLKPEDLQPSLGLDAEVGLDEISMDCLASLSRMRPMGQGNPHVQFCARNVLHHRPLQRIGADKQHVKMWVTDGTVPQEAVWWGAGGESLPVGRFDLAFVPQMNEFNRRKSIQLKVLDWRAASP
jgi:single-stranded-DNA-specific exonuclease